MTVLLCFAAAWACLEMKWRSDRIEADEQWRDAVWRAHAEVMADESRWS